MERLTVPEDILPNGRKRTHIIDAVKVEEHAMEFCWRLKAYEDTGLAPEDILAMKQELVDERHRHDRLMDFEVAEAQELAKVKADRDALLVTLKHYAPCEDCENWDMENEICVCSSDCKCGEKWSWRGHIALVSKETEAKLKEGLG